jgi:hypothetical protein
MLVCDKRKRLFGFVVFATVLVSISNSLAAMAPYRLADINWYAAIDFVNPIVRDSLGQLRKSKRYAVALAKIGTPTYIAQRFSTDLLAINAIASVILPNIHRAGSPVLLPLDVNQLIYDILTTNGEFTNRRKSGSYFGLAKPVAFFPGQYGYRAYFRIMNSSTVLVAGSSIFYELVGVGVMPQLTACRAIIDVARSGGAGASPEELNRSFFNYLREYAMGLGLIAAHYFRKREAAIPCLFAGSLIEVHILCDEKGDPDCQVQDLARSIIGMLSYAGGSPRPKRRPATNNPMQWANKPNEELADHAAQAGKVKLPAYRLPGDLLPGSGVNGQSGSADFSIYGAILFPTDPRLSAQSVIYRSDAKCLGGINADTGANCVHKGNEIKKAKIGEWRDNYYENRDDNSLLTCPAGSGHAGQDIIGQGNENPGTYPIRAVVDGIAFRRFPVQAAVTISDVSGSNIDYIYRHMRPSDLSEHGIPPGRPITVARGCVLAFVDRFERVVGVKSNLVDNGTYYDETTPHLHFEIRVPTPSGFQNVSPYWTLVQSHKFLSTKAGSTHLTDRSCGSPMAARR